MNKNIAIFIFISTGILLISLTILFCWVIFPKIIDSQVEQKMKLVDGSDTWRKWKEPPIPIYLTFHIYHVTNADEVEMGHQPRYQEKGPYCYRQKRVKEDISQENGTNTVKYREVKTFYFVQEKSENNLEDDLVNVVNIPFVGVMHAIMKSRRSGVVAGVIGNIILQDEPLIRKDIKVRELLFEGFDVTKYTNSSFKRRLPKQKLSGGRFGIYKGVNGTKSKIWEVYTGVENSLDFEKVKTWDGKRELGFWRKHSNCDKINGTDGTIFHPFLNKYSKIYAFSSDICRSIALEYFGDVKHLGIRGYRFKAAKGTFDDPRVNEENKCFCMEADIEECPHAGVMSLESCLKAPVWMSLPHFMDSDIRYLTESGLCPPQREKHETFLDIEPTTGLVIRAHKRLQVNIQVRRNSNVKALQNLTKEQFLFPLLWADESAELDEEQANKVKRLLYRPVEIVDRAKWIFLAMEMVLILAGIVAFIIKYNLFGIMAFRDQTKYASSAPLQSLRRGQSTSKVVAEEHESRAENSSSAI